MMYYIVSMCKDFTFCKYSQIHCAATFALYYPLEVVNNIQYQGTSLRQKRDTESQISDFKVSPLFSLYSFLFCSVTKNYFWAIPWWFPGLHFPAWRWIQSLMEI